MKLLGQVKLIFVDRKSAAYVVVAAAAVCLH